MTRDLKYLTLGVGFLAAMLVFSMAAAAGAVIIIALPALAQTDGGGGGSAIGGGGSTGGGITSTAITNAQMHLAQAMTSLQNKNTAGAMLELKLLNQSLSTLSTGAGGVATSGGNPGPGPSGSPSGGSSGSGPSGGPGAGSSGPGISGGGGPGAGSSGAGR
jgi:hypothetical protein